MDEGIVSTVELEEFHRLGLLDGIALKPARCGGLTEARRQIAFCREAGLMVLGSGLTDPDLALAAAALLYATHDVPEPYALNGPQFLEGSVLAEPLAVVDGKLTVPLGPGLGVTVDEARLAALAVTDV
jgi:L-alanine-DL-glutamate epimerase-like enolase superfamily enzyme